MMFDDLFGTKEWPVDYDGNRLRPPTKADVNEAIRRLQERGLFVTRDLLSSEVARIIRLSGLGCAVVKIGKETVT
jgi:hypothetical protein